MEDLHLLLLIIIALVVYAITVAYRAGYFARPILVVEKPIRNANNSK